MQPTPLNNRRYFSLLNNEGDDDEKTHRHHGWEPPDSQVFALSAQGMTDDYDYPMSLETIIRGDIDDARTFFTDVLLPRYRSDPGMYMKWGIMEYYAGYPDTARGIFKRGSKIIYDTNLWTSWATMERKECNFAESKALLQMVLKYEPDNPKAALGLIKVEQARGIENKQAIRDRLVALHAAHPEDSHILITLAAYESDLQHVEAARNYFEKSTTLDNPSHIPWQKWAASEMKQGEYEFAAEILQLGLKAHTRNDALLQMAAQVEYKAGRVLSARSIYQNLLDRNPDDIVRVKANIYTGWATMEEREGNLTRAKHILQDCLSRYPNDYAAISALANVFCRTNELDLSREVLQTGYRNTGNSKILMRWGDLEAKLEHFKEASALYQEASINRTDWFEPVSGWAKAEQRLGNFAEARVILENAASRFGTDYRFFLTLALMAKREDRFLEARGLLAKALRLDNTNAVIWNFKALLEFDLQHYSRATKIIETAFKFVPSSQTKSRAILLTTLGRVLNGQQDVTAAEKAFTQAIALDVTNPATHLIFARELLIPTQQIARAIDHFTHVIPLIKVQYMDTHRAELKELKAFHEAQPPAPEDQTSLNRK